MAEQLDIITTIHRRLWAVLSAWGPLSDLVTVANRVDVTADDFDSFPPNEGPDERPEIVIVQADFSQDRYSSGDGRVARRQAFALIASDRGLRVVTLNAIKVAVLDALVERGGPTLGLASLGVHSYSVGGRDAMTADPGTPPEDREEFGVQSLMNITVEWHKSVPRSVPPLP